MIGDILQKQGQIVVYYEKKLKGYEKENKKLNSRLVKARNAGRA